jgi:hypothetical protein
MVSAHPVKHFGFAAIAMTLLALAWALSAKAQSQAQSEDESSFRLSGFLSVVGGQVFGGSSQDRLESKPEFDCPCYVADWANAGVYGQKFTLKPESRIGVQADVTLARQLDFTAQLMSRGTEPKPDLEWAYLTYRIDGQWDVQAGRKRIPLYFYSASQDIGYSYPWIGAPPELYGWEVTNYNGASVRYRGNAAGASLVASVFAGEESVKEARIYKIYEAEDFDVKWKNILGGDLELSGGWWTARLIYLQSKNTLTGRESLATYNHDMQAYGAAFNADFGPWFILSEAGVNRRKYDSGNYLRTPSLTVGAGYRAGKWTPFLNYAQYRDITDIPDYGPANWKRWSFTLCHDLTSSSALKAQVDRVNSRTTDVTGDANVFRLGFDLVF